MFAFGGSGEVQVWGDGFETMTSDFSFSLFFISFHIYIKELGKNAELTTPLDEEIQTACLISYPVPGGQY